MTRKPSASMHKLRVGAVFPQTEMPVDPVAIRDYAVALEEMNFAHLVVYDHVLGADLANRPGWKWPYDLDSTFQEPFVLMGYLAAITRRLELTTGVLILPQRQAALVAKQAACADILTGGRIRLGVGTGWNELEYEALGMPFENRGARMTEQIDFMRRLWTERSFSYDGQFHRLNEGGIWPLPLQKPIPIWAGGNSNVAMRRAAKLADGWLPSLAPVNAASEIARFRQMVAESGRDPNDIGIDNIIFCGRTHGRSKRTCEEAAADIATMQEAGATHVSMHTMDADLATPDAHLEFLRKASEAFR